MSEQATIESLTKQVAALAGKVERLQTNGMDLLPVEEDLALKMMAREEARGNPGPRKEWNRRMKRIQEKEFEREGG